MDKDFWEKRRGASWSAANIVLLDENLSSINSAGHWLDCCNTSWKNVERNRFKSFIHLESFRRSTLIKKWV